MTLDRDRGDDGKKYEWQSWPSNSLEGMPPKRRRLAVWGLLWLMLLSVVPRILLDALGMPQPWRSVAFAAIVATIFIPLIRGAVLETRALRAEGVDMPTFTITRKTLLTSSIITGLLWIAYASIAFAGEFIVPLVPIACTVWLALKFRRWADLPHR